jgi:hypothetical protein
MGISFQKRFVAACLKIHNLRYRLREEESSETVGYPSDRKKKSTDDCRDNVRDAGLMRQEGEAFPGKGPSPTVHGPSSLL